jgi:hypothetical protein
MNQPTADEGVRGGSAVLISVPRSTQPPSFYRFHPSSFRWSCPGYSGHILHPLRADTRPPICQDQDCLRAESDFLNSFLPRAWKLCYMCDGTHSPTAPAKPLLPPSV